MSLRAAILGFLLIVIATAVAGAWWLYASRDALLKRAIERYGPEVTGVSVKVKAVKIEPLDGRGAITGLDIGNPRGFSAPHALTLGEVQLAVDPKTLTSDVVHVQEISFEAPSITYERRAQGDNLSTIQKHIESQLPRSRESAEGKKDDGAPQRKFIVDHVQVRKAKVSYGGLVSADLPDLHLRDLGKKRGGATAAEITDEIWNELSRTAIARAPAAIEGLRDKAKDAAERLRGLVR